MFGQRLKETRKAHHYTLESLAEAYNARFAGGGEVEKLAGITLQAEKEVLAIVAPNKLRRGIMEEIDRLHGLRSSAQAAVVALPIDHTARLD